MATPELAGSEWVGHARGHGSPTVIALNGGPATGGITHLFPLSVVTAVGGISFALTTAGGGGNRQVVVQLQDGFGNAVYGIAAPDPQGGGLTVTYSFGPGVTTFGTSALGFQGGPLPYGRLPENLALVVQVVSAAGGDVLFNGRLMVTQWPAGQDVLGGSAAG